MTVAPHWAPAACPPLRRSPRGLSGRFAADDVPRSGRAHAHGKRGPCRRLPSCIHPRVPVRAAWRCWGSSIRDQLFPRPSYARTFEALTASLAARPACRTMVGGGGPPSCAGMRGGTPEPSGHASGAGAARTGPSCGRQKSCRIPGNAGGRVRSPQLAAYAELGSVPSSSGGMKAADPITRRRPPQLALTDLSLPAIKLVWPDFAARSDKGAGRPRALWPRSPSERWPNGPVDGSSVISTKPACQPEDVRQFQSWMRCP